MSFEKLDVPYLWINGEQDKILKKYRSESNENIIFKYSGHYPHIEETDKFVEIINSFLIKN
ncbi:MAG: hypothetical protein CL678_07435 [Bdellovibrionaceae bacterium]|nr:hypothetical protein [Pseudobdellovibrionaceae bacterium]